MNLNHVYAIMLRQWYLLRGNTTRVIQLFLWSAVEVSIWGFTTVYLSEVAQSSFQFVLLLLGGILLWEFLIRAMHGMITVFFEDVWSHNFLNLFSSPMTRAEYITGLVATSTVTSIISFTLVALMCWFAFGLSLFTFGLPLIGFLLSLFIFGVALGLLGLSMVIRFGPAAEWLIWPIPAVISPFVGVLYPVAQLPVVMQWVSVILPPRYTFEGMRSLVHGGSVHTEVLVLAVVLSCVYVALAYAFFNATYTRATRVGLIARYSAEDTTG
jgi:ABC-2 type transport system permease protein